MFLTQQMCDGAVDDYLDTYKFVPDRYKTCEMCDKAVDDYSVALEFVLDRYKSKEMCDTIIYKNHFSLR